LKKQGLEILANTVRQINKRNKHQQKKNEEDYIIRNIYREKDKNQKLKDKL
jgi:hypothetical protein